MTHLFYTRFAVAKAGLAFLLAAFVATGCARKDEHAAFDSAEAAVAAFVEARGKDDTATMQRLLGPGSEGLLSSGDALQDKGDRAAFLAAYREKQQARRRWRRRHYPGHRRKGMAVPDSGRQG